MDHSRIATCSGWKAIPEQWLGRFEVCSGDALAMLESPVQEYFDTLGNVWDEIIKKPPWEKGEIFCPECSLRWRKRMGVWYAVMIMDSQEDFPEGFEAQSGLVPEEDYCVLLWGQRKTLEDGRITWFEDRVAGANLHYPLLGEGSSVERGRAILHCRRYRFEEGGTFIHRWRRIEGI